MITDEIRERIRSATVRFQGGDGQGFWVPGDLVVTAARCVNLADPQAIIENGPELQHVVNADGHSRGVIPVFVDLAADIAVFRLGEEDDALCEHDWIPPLDSTSKVVPDLPLLHYHQRGTPFPVYTLTSTGNWIAGTATLTSRDKASPFVWIEFAGVDGDTTGAPVIDDQGNLLFVAPAADHESRRCSGLRPYLSSALPQWVLDRITGARLTDEKVRREWTQFPTGFMAELLAAYRDHDLPEISRSIAMGDRTGWNAFLDRCDELDVKPELRNAFALQMRRLCLDGRKSIRGVGISANLSGATIGGVQYSERQVEAARDCLRSIGLDPSGAYLEVALVAMASRKEQLQESTTSDNRNHFG